MPRIKESELVVPALQAAAEAGGEITMTKLIEVLTDKLAPSGKDAEILDGRHDTHFSQKVRNLVSHKGTASSMFTRGLAIHHAATESIQVTQKGLAYIGYAEKVA